MKEKFETTEQRFKQMFDDRLDILESRMKELENKLSKQLEEWMVL